MKDIPAKFAIIDDPRHSGYITHKLEHILTIVMCAVLCGLDQLDDILVYQENHQAFLKTTFGIEHYPSKSTYSRVLSIIDGHAVGQVIIQIMKQYFPNNGDIVAVDGKAIRSTAQKGTPHSALQILSAYLTENGVILGQESIHEKTNEIPAFQQMLGYLDIEGKVITADAMHCQKETCRKIIEKKGHYVLGLKSNQPTLYKNTALYYADPELKKEMAYHKTIEKNRGRIESRTCWKLEDLSWLEERDQWEGLKCIFAIERTVKEGEKESQETSYYISSLDESPERLMEIAREHWKIESMHWMLDVTFGEDGSQFSSKNAQETLNAMRKLALAVHKNYLKVSGKKSSVKASMLSCLMSSSSLCKILESL